MSTLLINFIIANTEPPFVSSFPANNLEKTALFSTAANPPLIGLALCTKSLQGISTALHALLASPGWLHMPYLLLLAQVQSSSYHHYLRVDVITSIAGQIQHHCDV